ncbi:Rieske iron-sulfur protein, ubiquinol-cytochrome C reductase iron-sulfur subunit (macronuclear) [Tetrahymena thermophila SB210]|uniref:Rieske iron-sulfur protein, ubiquinol-cytochrome C reductase iron-sulfur subunit n=1 Tax=Tetrahymena thermophila (strain SB210) TaxID=312017 RepID=I7MIC7_TETTS|nr:Rieske iron-sulfur protein, ubiquinol-cytochrome C reductase iron-sulfur subunit [Tetrahymena thermophila SB210]7TGH_3E Chain 3E, Rieske iron-sulfur protein, ubiquinol-cytochrome C reductase iron-sulfur subunit [Tetrahymena thermophila]7TGH_3e Chain 3e, Rieske iron-sulfur protein, ubiquinol-cytochrome C reductase iron-sulfur subunit [Tetrahymena thermophila]8B6J_E Chain E, Rieske iron-sulfur protein, ubiquinol-cytochrome C reductase iron-sulfur subunit [Tetrahymena thermophila SB210]8B6J_e C|eukprot:XP_001013140.2 Rieske iron-sulfur protein, ubiquinol-cytochrome C reductase iron-sulfur subunit [Tetrahymena thermophila SB210]
MFSKTLAHVTRSCNKLNQVQAYNFGVLSEYNQRLSKKLHKGHLVEDKPTFFVTSSRPGNFGDHIDFKVNIDNWFDENRVHNEHETDIRRTQIYTLNAIYYGGLLSFARLYAMGVIGRLNGWKRYERDTYSEVDIGALPPGEVMQMVWNGTPIFIRRLTSNEVKEENELPSNTLLDKDKEVILSDAGNTKVIVVSAVCTHLGCIPIPYLGAYKGYVCICHGSVYDKFARVRQGPALLNLPAINNSIHDEGTLVCMEQLKFPHEPSQRFWA